jgi:hypothetical protein
MGEAAKGLAGPMTMPRSARRARHPPLTPRDRPSRPIPQTRAPTRWGPLIARWLRNSSSRSLDMAPDFFFARVFARDPVLRVGTPTTARHYGRGGPETARQCAGLSAFDIGVVRCAHGAASRRPCRGCISATETHQLCIRLEQAVLRSGSLCLRRAGVRERNAAADQRPETS